MSDDFAERLSESDRVAALLRRALSQPIEQICAGVRLAPDWLDRVYDDANPPSPGHIRMDDYRPA